MSVAVSGTAEIEGEPEELFDRLLDPAVLSRCIRGCESMERVEEGVYQTRLAAGVGAVKGSFDGRVTLSDVERPVRYRMSVEGKSPVGHLSGGALIELVPGEGTSTIRYEGEAQVAGLIASVGNRLLLAAARAVARDFFNRLAAECAATAGEEPE